ncbi:MAG: hypothetical protein ACK5G0_08995 [Bacteroidota bacterium]|jgi:hypothetical protein
MKNELATAVKQVLEDFPNGYKNLMGEPGDSSFESKIKIADAEDVQFVQHSQYGRSVVSWQARLFTTEDHDQARKKFKAAYQQLQGLSVKLGARSYKLRSAYDVPDLNEKFTALIFELEPSNSYTEPIKVELQMLFQMPMEWSIGVLVYERDRKDTEPGRILRSF